MVRADVGGNVVAVVLSGGGARAAYQVGLLRCVADMAPESRFPIITGVSAGAVNAAFLTSHPGGIAQATEDLCRLWSRLEVGSILNQRVEPDAEHCTLGAQVVFGRGSLRTGSRACSIPGLSLSC
jgi:predicted acylesterase/phospholipase RssA